ncbi:MAG TPA: hypothetical protein VL943_02815, partial [Niabella sp.]|nr:hypothetical protein [Niabella sp.]
MSLSVSIKGLAGAILIGACLSSLSSCKKYLDIVPDNVGTLDYAFRNKNEAENYLFTCYSTM